MAKRFDVKIEDDRLLVYNLGTEPLYIKGDYHILRG
jgi:hypothetical protein